MKHVVTHCRADNDVNGNPRRLFLVAEITDQGSNLVDVIDEGYNGREAYFRKYPEAVMLTTIDIGAKEYKRLKGLL